MYLPSNLSLAIKNVPPRPGPGFGADPEHAARSEPLLPKVLVVDDDRDLADMANYLLTAHGLEVRVAYSAAEALTILETDADIGAVFSDIMMPVMTGLQLAEVVAERYPDVRMVLTSGFTSPAMLAEYQRGHLFVAKPYRIEAVVKLLCS